MAATIRDVARHAEVSVASVSRALNGHSNVHPDTRARVTAAAAALGYVPHAGARSLSMSRSQAIGVVLPDLHGEFFSEFVRGIDREASAQGYQLLLSNMHADIAMAGQALMAMRGRVDGLIVMAPQVDASSLDRTLPAGIPAILVNTADGAGRQSMRIDNRGGAEAVARHLIAIGRRHIVHIAGPEGNIDARERRAGVEAVISSERGVSLTILPGNFDEESGARAVQALIAQGTACDAIFAANDMTALGALLALRDAKIAVPDTIALAGFDDIPLARYLSLTTMRVDMAALGARAVMRLIGELDGAEPDLATEQVPVALVVRATTENL